MDKDTIAAISTPQGKGGIGIVRISGPKALEIAKKVTESKLNILSFQKSQSRKLVYAHLLDKKQEKIDEILIAIMPAKKSFTGEVSVELNCHGGRAILYTALESILEAGAHLAKPGEFTRRAVENGRIDIAQAEAINELINARTQKAMKNAFKLVDGVLSRKCIELRNEIISILMQIEAVINFEVYPKDEQIKEWDALILKSETIIQGMAKAADRNKYFNQGCWVALTGPPNAGKSSIFNLLLGNDRSLICDKPGTTRDHINESIEIEGIEVKLMDTAGIRKTKNKIEKMSVERTKKQIEKCDIIIYVLDQSKKIKRDQLKETEKILSRNGFVVFNKSDLKINPYVKKFIETKKNKSNIHVSAITKAGIDELLDKLAEKITEDSQDNENNIITNIRQADLLKSTGNLLKSARDILPNQDSLDLVVYEIEKAKEKIEEIIGIITKDEILENIFQKFCVGK